MSRPVDAPVDVLSRSEVEPVQDEVFVAQEEEGEIGDDEVLLAVQVAVEVEPEPEGDEEDAEVGEALHGQVLSLFVHGWCWVLQVKECYAGSESAQCPALAFPGLFIEVFFEELAGFPDLLPQ